MKSSLPQQVYKQLKEMLRAGAFPPGVRLKYVRLAAQLGVSTTPVREAMTLLAGEGFVLLLPGTGAVVRTIEQNELEHVYGVREAIEAHATGLAASRISVAKTNHLAALQRTMQQLLATCPGGVANPLELVMFCESDFAFHTTIAEASGNSRLATITAEIAPRSWRFEHGNRQPAHDALRMIVESHQAILDALLDRDTGRARELMAGHLRHECELSLGLRP